MKGAPAAPAPAAVQAVVRFGIWAQAEAGAVAPERAGTAVLGRAVSEVLGPAQMGVQMAGAWELELIG